jgi:multicomponent Na+:H+ antiporter subunit F
MMLALAVNLPLVIDICLAVLSVSLLLTFIRLVRGPSLPDRVVALDQFAALAVGVIALFTISSGRAEVLRAAIVLALISFLGTVAFARYAEKGGRP